MVFSFVGFPLSGKSILVKYVSEMTGFPVLSTGEIARRLGMKAEKSIKTHDLSVDLNDAIIDMVLSFIESNEHVILDGFPRSEEQIKLLMRYESKVIFVGAEIVTILDRAKKRNRDMNDMTDVVIGRIESAIRLKQKLFQIYGHIQYFDSNVDDEYYTKRRDKLCEMIGGWSCGEF